MSRSCQDARKNNVHMTTDEIENRSIKPTETTEGFDWRTN